MNTRTLIDAKAGEVWYDARWTLGYPCANTSELIPWDELAPLRKYMINQAGNPSDSPRSGYRPHLRDWEEEILDRAAGWFGMRDDYWGYLASGSSEAIGMGLRLGREIHPNGMIYCSREAHLIAKAWIGILDRYVIEIDTLADGSMDAYDLLRKIVSERPAIVLTTAGTTMREAIDSLKAINAALEAAGIPHERRYVHRDSALSGAALAVSENEEWRNYVNLGFGFNSINVSTHKLWGTPNPGALFLCRREGVDSLRTNVPYLKSAMATVSCSRSGQAVAETWLALKTWDDEQLHHIVEECRRLAQYLTKSLVAIGIPAQRADHGMTVWFPAPALWIAETYGLAVDGMAHIVTVPGKDISIINSFISNMEKQDDHDGTSSNLLSDLRYISTKDVGASH